jgi:hypothetical protein
MTTWTLTCTPYHTRMIIGTSAHEVAARRDIIRAADTLLQQNGSTRYELAVDGDIVAIIQTGDEDNDPVEMRGLLNHLHGVDPFR